MDRSRLGAVSTEVDGSDPADCGVSGSLLADDRPLSLSISAIISEANFSAWVMLAAAGLVATTALAAPVVATPLEDAVADTSANRLSSCLSRKF